MEVGMRMEWREKEKKEKETKKKKGRELSMDQMSVPQRAHIQGALGSMMERRVAEPPPGTKKNSIFFLNSFFNILPSIVVSQSPTDPENWSWHARKTPARGTSTAPLTHHQRSELVGELTRRARRDDETSQASTRWCKERSGCGCAYRGKEQGAESRVNRLWNCPVE